MKTKEELRRIMPDRVKMLPLDAAGNMVLWFAQPRSGRLEDHKTHRLDAVDQALTHDRCYVCGQPLGRNKSFLIGPVGALRQTALDPPCHRSCAVFAAQACPYYTQPRLRPDAIALNNSTCVWVTRTFTPFQVDNTVHFRLGKPIEVTWFRQGEKATHADIVRSTQSALSVLIDIARDDGDAAVNALLQSLSKLRQYLPPEQCHGNDSRTPSQAEADPEAGPRAAAGGCR